MYKLCDYTYRHITVYKYSKISYLYTHIFSVCPGLTWLGLTADGVKLD